MILAHLSDLHLRGEDDAVAFASQLDRIVRRADHLVISGDLLDRWQPALLARIRDLLHQRGLLTPDALTLVHGNHDLASSGGHPQQRSDLRRLAVRFWDPPPVIASRRRRFYAQLAAPGASGFEAPPFHKTLTSGIRLAAVDSIPAPWMPFAPGWGRVTVAHARGAFDQQQAAWLSTLRGTAPLVIVVHHYPLPVPAFRWHTGRVGGGDAQSWLGRRLASWVVEVPMEIDPADRERFWKAARAADAALVVCGHVHRARLDRHEGVAVGLNGQSGAAWAGRTVAYYRIDSNGVTVEYESSGGVRT